MAGDKIQFDRFIVSMPTKYHPYTVKYIAALDGKWCIATQSIPDHMRYPDAYDRIRRDMWLYIMKLDEKKFEFLGTHIEIYFNVYYKRYFWVTGTSPERFYGGASQYFKSVQSCEEDVRMTVKYHWEEENKDKVAGDQNSYVWWL